MPKKLPTYLTKEEFVNLIKHTHKKKHKVAFLLGFGSGLRISEVINLEQRDINLQNKSIFVRQGKGKKDRVVPLPKGFKEPMIKHIPINVGVRGLQKAFKNACKRAGILESKPELHFHSLRHSFATRLLESGVPINQVQLALGHSSVSTTGIYLRANPKDMLENYEKYF